MKKTLADQLIHQNNPVAICFSKKNNWKGQVTTDNNFCSFVSLQFCFRAWLKILSSYAKRGILSIDDIISTYAPTSENDTLSYIGFIKNAFKEYNVFMYDINFIAYLFKFMCFFETNYTINVGNILILIDSDSELYNLYYSLSFDYRNYYEKNFKGLLDLL